MNKLLELFLAGAAFDLQARILGEYKHIIPQQVIGISLTTPEEDELLGIIDNFLDEVGFPAEWDDDEDPYDDWDDYEENIH